MIGTSGKGADDSSVQEISHSYDGRKITKSLKIFSIASGILAIVACAALVGWYLDIHILTGFGLCILVFSMATLTVAIWLNALRLNLLTANQRARDLEETQKKFKKALEETQKLRTTFMLEVKTRTEQKEQLFAMLTHDLRNPLSAIMGHIQLMMIPDNANDQMKEQAKNAHRACEHLLEMINQILDVMRMQDDKMPIKMARQDLVPLIQKLAEEYKAVAKVSGILIKLEAHQSEVVANVDLEILERVMENLITNAVKHTPRDGSVILGAERDGSSVLVWVEDTGEGIPPEYRNMIFQKYGQVKTKKMGKRFDTGLGLLFCRKAIELQNGKIYLDEKTTVGSKFVIELPQ